jgi:hypothetical protein
MSSSQHHAGTRRGFAFRHLAQLLGGMDVDGAVAWDHHASSRASPRAILGFSAVMVPAPPVSTPTSRAQASGNHVEGAWNRGIGGKPYIRRKRPFQS